MTAEKPVMRQLKDSLYEQLARIGKAFSSSRRLQLLELLAQGEKTVETLAQESGIDVRLASAHLQTLRNACLVQARRDGKYVFYRLAGEDVAGLIVSLRRVAQGHLLELKKALERIVGNPEKLTAYRRDEFMEMAKNGELVVIDVRPRHEYEAGHLPFARSMPVEEIVDRLSELPKDREIVAYCRGPFCLLSDDAVALLEKRGYRVSKISDGVAEWHAAGLPLEKKVCRQGKKNESTDNFQP